MGSAVSRVARRASPAAVAQAQASGQAVRQAVSPAELQRQAQIQEALRHVKAEESKNEQLVSDMTKLMTSIGTRQVELYTSPETDRLYARKKKTKEEKEAEQLGRLSTASLKALYGERISAWQQGKQLSVEELAKQYGANEEVLRAVLQYNTMPAVQQAEDGRLIGSWPE